MMYNPITVLRMREFGETVLSNLASNDPRISGCIRLSHPDGSTSVIACAYPQIVGDWLYVFSLIDGFVLFGKQEVASWQQESKVASTTLGITPVARSENGGDDNTVPGNLAA